VSVQLFNRQLTKRGTVHVKVHVVKTDCLILCDSSVDVTKPNYNYFLKTCFAFKQLSFG